MAGQSGHGILAPSAWVVRWAPLMTQGTVLDVACGEGRHARFFAARGLQVVAVDREPPQAPFGPGVRFVQADLEGAGPWPLAGERFAGVVVTNYLHRPLLPRLAESLAPGGVLVYETFMAGNERYGKPSNPEFLLRAGELLEAFRDLTVVAFEQGNVARPKPAMVQRLCALRGAGERAKILD
jgi:SAM-dependent methyltransferase